MRVRTPLLLSAALLSSALIPLGGSAAADTGPVPLGLSSVADLVVDEAHGRVFVSGGPSGPGVVVTDLAGTVITTLQHSGATGLALSPDGSRLWLAQPQMGLVGIDTATLIPDKRYPLPTGVCAGDVAVAGDRQVYGYSCNSYSPSGGGYGGIGVLDAATGTSFGTVTSGPWYEPRVATGPAGQVYAADAGRSSTDLQLYDVREPEPVLVGSRAGVCGNLRDLSPSPDGALVVTSCGSPYEHTTYSGSQKLELTHTYATGAYPVAGAWSPGGGVFAAGTDSPYGTDVHVYPAGSTTPAWTRDFGSSAAVLQPRGLALSADGSRAWAVTRGSSGGVDLQVLHSPERTASSLTLAADPPSFFVGEASDIGGWLSEGGVGIAGATVTVTRAATGANPVALPSVTTTDNGTFSFTDSPNTAGDYTYTASWAGDATRAGVQATASVTVHPLGTLLELRVDRTSSADQVLVGALLRYSDGSSAEGRLVHLRREWEGTSTALPDLVTDVYGNATMTDTPPAGTVTYVATVDTYGSHPAAKATATTTLLTPTTLTAGAPATSTVDTPLQVSGVLTDPAGPVVSATVSVVRSGCGADWAASALTTPNGAWSVTDPAPVLGTCTYRATYAGGGGYASSSASTSTTVTLHPTALTAAAKAGGEAGSPVAVTGTLLSGSAAVSGALLSVSRTGCSSTGWSGAATTAADGSWSATDPAAPGGTCTYTATYAGSETYAGSTSDPNSITVTYRTPALTLSAVRGTGSAKKQVVVTATLGAWHTNRTVTITAQGSSGGEVVIASGPVDATGSLSVIYSQKSTTTYRVRYDGDDWYARGSVQQVL